jgi:hypothetical protein
MVSASFAGTTVAVAPSTCRQVELQLQPGHPTGYVHEPISFLLHLLSAAGCVTHLVPATHTSARLGMI